MSLPSINKCVVLAERPDRGPITPRTFKKDAQPLKKPADGEVVVKTELLSIVSLPHLPSSIPVWLRQLGDVLDAGRWS